ncbi:MAG: RHS repeat-associated core domain-containing protein, partial [candidate division Zixibacteria bacterium]|nr:RHS repeat-associated core domain-containing protein [candidate division Zixibacteria bacterium]
IWSAKYGSFGKAEIDVETTVINNLHFPGQIYDEENKFGYNWFRYYDFDQGRYFKNDPIWFLSGEFNRYVYVSNNPANKIDPMGLFEPFPIIVKPDPSYPCLRYSKKQCQELKKFIEGQILIRQRYISALGTGKEVEFPPGTRKLADPSMSGCLEIKNPGIKSACFAHETSHLAQVPNYAHDAFKAKNQTERIDIIYLHEKRISCPH